MIPDAISRAAPPPLPPTPKPLDAGRLAAGRTPVQAAVERYAQAQDPVSQGAALRQLDALLGRQGTLAQLAAPGGGGSAALTGPDRGDDGRNVGRGSVRPHLGDGPATPSGVTPGGGMPGFPTPPAAPKTGDGSGPHGVEGAGLGDRMWEQVAYRMADAADAVGLNNAARNLRHYLGNTGEPLQVDPATMKKDLPEIGAEMDGRFQSQVRDVALAKVQAEYDGKPMQFQITTPWNGAYATKEMSPDWFYGVGGFSYAHTATVTVTPGADGKAQVHIDSQLHVFDRYNWDAGKGVKIGPVGIPDGQMGRLHTVGLAREFEVRGTATGPSADFTVTR